MANITNYLSGSNFRGFNLLSEDFEPWTTRNHFRTSSLDMSYKMPAPHKTYVIPGYAGHIPGTKDTPLEKSATWISKEQLNRTNFLPSRTIDVFPNKPVKTNRKLGRVGGGLPDEYHTVSRFHGKTTIPMTHPNIQDNLWITSSSFSYVNQEELRQRVYRKSSYSPIKAKKVHRPQTTASGFVQNSTLFDGHGWLPIEKFHGDMKPSEYRNRFNPDVPFHPKPRRANTRTLRRKELVY